MRAQRHTPRKTALRICPCWVAMAPTLGIGLGSLALGGCLPEQGDPGTPAPIVRTSEQIERDRKADRLPVRLTSQTVRRSDRADRLAAPRKQKIADLPAPEPVPAPAPAPLPPAQPAPATQVGGGGEALARFHTALRQLEEGKRHKPVTILHLGDSHIASDRVTGDLRALFQARFGDAGRGLMMPGFPFTYYRARGVRFAKRGHWTSANSFKGHAGPYGLTGVRLTTRAKKARLSLASGTGPFEWAEVSLLAGPGRGTAFVGVDGHGKVVRTKSRRQGVERVRIDHKGIELSLRAEGDGPVTILSWAVGHNRPGVRYVNLGLPGATADTPRRWDWQLVADDIARISPDLIVLGFGTNEGFNDRLDVAAYERRVRALLRRLAEAAPAASLAVMGPPDSARFPRFANGRASAKCVPLSAKERRDYRTLSRTRARALARWHPPPRLADVRGALRAAAAGRQAYFWDWAQAMGGPCAIDAWARAKPKLAFADRVHLTRAGGLRVAQALFDSLMTGYAAPDKLASRAGAPPAPNRVR